MMSILLPVLLVAGIGLIAGLGLAVASVVMAVPKDEKAEAIEGVLSGANCGACGFSGCAGYAKALADGTASDTTLCSPGGAETAQAVAEILGVAAGSVTPMTAVVLCRGNHTNTDTKMEYSGVMSCKMASQLFGGPGQCSYGCIGYGDCVQACPYGAIMVCEGVARIDPAVCRACKVCVNTCPQKLITLMPIDEAKAAVLCRNQEKGGQTRKHCKAGCIGCMRCVKACESGAITVTDNLARIDPDACTACGKCVAVCPSHCIALPAVPGTVSQPPAKEPEAV